MSFFIRKILFPTVIFISVFILTFQYVKHISNKHKPVNYTLKSYNNTIALYNGEEIIEIYTNIVLNTLPEKDIQNFNSGIPVTTPTQAQILLDDYDS